MNRLNTTYQQRRNFFQNFLKAMITICSLYISFSTANAQNNMDQLIRSLSTEKDDSTLLQAYVLINRYYQGANPDSAIYYLQGGIDKFTANNYKKGIITLTSSLAQIDGMQGRMDLAKQRHTLALKLSREENYSKGIATALNGLGVVEGRKGNYEEATRYFLEALKEFERTGNQAGITNTYIKLGSVNDLSGNLQKGLEYNLLVLDRSKNDPNPFNYISAQSNIGIIYYKLGEKKKALDAFIKALNMSKSPEFHSIHISALNSLGNYYINEKKPKAALQYFNQGLKLAIERGYIDDKIRFILNIENIRSLRNPQMAIEELNKILAEAIKIGHKPLEIEIRNEIAVAQGLTKNYKVAFEELLNKNKVEDSLLTINSTAEISNLQSTHELAKSKAKVSQLVQTENKVKKEKSNVLIVAIILGLCLFGVSFFYLKSKELNKKLRIQGEDLKKSNQIKDRVFSIIGHDLRGPVANIPMMLDLYINEANSDEEKKIMLEALNENSQASLDTLDKLLYWGKSQIKGKSVNQKNFNANESLKDILKLFTGLAKYKQIVIVNNVLNNIDIYADADHFNFIVRNLLSNAVKFTYSKGLIEIDAKYDKAKEEVTFSVKDNGVGIDKNQQHLVFDPFNKSTSGTSDEKGHSIGLMLCKEFVNESGGKIWLESKKGEGTTIFFTVESYKKSAENTDLTFQPEGYQTAH